MELTRENYRSKENTMRYMSVSQFKAFRKCEAAALAEIKGEWKSEDTTALLVGSYVDEYLNGTLDEFIAAHPEIISSRGPSKGGLKSEFVKAQEIIERINRDKFFRARLGGKRQVIMTGVIGGVEWKIMIDSMHPKLTVDGKIMKDCNDVRVVDGYEPFWRAYGYDIQGAVYQKIRAQNEGVVKPFELAVATKEKEVDLRIFRFTDSTLQNAYYEVVEYVKRYDDIKKGKIKPVGCGVCDYCKSIRKLSAKDIEEI